MKHIAQAAIVAALFVLTGAQALAQEEEQTPVCYDVNPDVDIEENVCFPRIDGYSLRTVFSEGGSTESTPYGSPGWLNVVWYGGLWRGVTAYYAAADPRDQLESRVLIVSVDASAAFPLHARTRNPRLSSDGSGSDQGRWGYESALRVSAYLMTAAHDDPHQNGRGRSLPYNRVVLRDNGNLVIEDCRYREDWPTSTRVAHDTDWPIKVNRMIRRYLEREDAPAACSVEAWACDPISDSWC